MQMTFRWYGEGNDRISLSDIKQIPGVTGIVWALHHNMPGEIWEESEIAEVKRQLDQYGEVVANVDGVDVYYHSYTNKLVPPDYKMTDEDKKAEENGELVFSYGSSEVEIKEVQSVSWKKDGMY